MTNIWDYKQLIRVADFDIWYCRGLDDFDFGHTGKHTFEQAVGLFYHETGLLPPDGMTVMYHEHDDSYRYHANEPAIWP